MLRRRRVTALVRPRGGLGVVLDAEGGEPTIAVAQFESLDDVVVEADVGDDGLAVGRVDRRVEPDPVGPADREPVVVGRHLDLPGGAVHDRLVDAAVAVDQLVGAEPERAPEELVAEADPEVGQPPLQRSPQPLIRAVTFGGRVKRMMEVHNFPRGPRRGERRFDPLPLRAVKGV